MLLFQPMLPVGSEGPYVGGLQLRVLGETWLHLYINCQELLAVYLALRCFLLVLEGKHVLVRTDSMAMMVYINHIGGIRSHRMSQLTRHLLLGTKQ